MKKTALFLMTILLCINALSQSNKIEVKDYNGLKPYLSNRSDTVFVVNFWATWCKPCVDELPMFVKVSREKQHEKVKFIFVSLDFRKQLESRLQPFVDANLNDQTVILLNDLNANDWIEQIDTQWSGAIPATLFYKNNQRTFHEGSLTEDELLKQISVKQ
jgi:thiol-disulfide isomerase/thioredoxin